MVGLIAADVQENYTGKFDTSAIHCRVNLDGKAIQMEEANYKELPVYYDFCGKKDEILRQNFTRITNEVENIVKIFRKPAETTAAQPKTPKNGLKK
jgi:hypothetical protein